jgi:serine/threonine-protein kinase RsbW/stage II sporulation protein AB (anti-sigma F factor)
MSTSGDGAGVEPSVPERPAGTGAPDVADGVAASELLVYERLLPAVPTTVSRVRRDLGEALERWDVAVDRRADIALTVTEAATNAVVHAYAGQDPGPLYVAATLANDTLTVAVVDCGRGVRPRLDSPGAGFGIPLMTRLTDDLRICSGGLDQGTYVQATFEGAAWGGVMPAAPPTDARGEMLRDYARVLAGVSASLQQDTQAVLSEAQQTLAHARRLRRDRLGRA